MSGELDLGQRIRAVLALDPRSQAVEYHGIWHSWEALATIAGEVECYLRKTVSPGVPAGLVLRNDPAMLGAMLGVLLAGGCIVTINPSQGDDGLAADLAELRVPVILAVDEDWARPGLRDAAAGSLGVCIRADPAAGDVVDGLAGLDSGPFRAPLPGVAVEMLTSGTTGAPKRVPLTYEALARSILAAGAHYTAHASDEVRLSSGIAIISSPLVHMSGLFRSLFNICQGRRIALMDRFRVPEFVALVQRHRPRAISLVPAALGMVLDAEVDPAAMSSVQVVTSGTSHLPVALQERFEERFGVAVLPSYGATEFAGGVAGWNLKLYQEWGPRKRGSVGRPQSGREVRVVSPEGKVLPAGVGGLIEVRAGGEWVRTTDLGRVDADGFVFIDGRSDDVIVRGGFKITPATIVKALREHPSVRDAGVTGIPDERLGAVPVAAVELKGNCEATQEELVRFLRHRVTAYEMPAKLLIVDALPRTPSLKVSQPGLREMFAG
jgi:acyl-CoA synthetase (AMP-forming)/AMP-acid ligase II